MATFKSFTYELLEELGDDHALGCKCCRFGKGVDLPIPQTLSPQETESAAKEFSKQVMKNWTMLNAIAKRFEHTIQRRWM